MTRLIAYVDGSLPSSAKIEIARELGRGLEELVPSFLGQAPLIDWELFGNEHDETKPRVLRVIGAVTKSGTLVTLYQVNDDVVYESMRPASLTAVSMELLQNILDAWDQEAERPD